MCAVAVVPPNDESGEDRAARSDTAPEGVALTVQGVKPASDHFLPFGRPARKALDANFGPGTIVGRWDLWVATFGAIPFTAA